MVWTCKKCRRQFVEAVGKPKKKWRACLIDDINTLGIEEHMTKDRQLWKAVITSPTPSQMVNKGH